ncbi:hypothetical protein QYE76_028753 [Lolium multiflorum]|uniref:CCHC-type domain-containing protein n=1 Tax=Lolium multiflorum TaxID=4521 RepID=A0AAD8QMI7_LOLMU|nr:hypothetical protein QYE76_028753 [Lolium multiflorum]
MKFGLDQLQGLVRSYLNNRYQEETSIARGGEEQLDMKTDVKMDVKLDMELDMKISHGRAREEREACAREKKTSRPVQTRSDAATANRSSSTGANRTRFIDDVLNGKIDEISQKLDATHVTVTTMQDQMTDVQRNLADLRLAVENLTAQQQQDDDDDPELQDDAHNDRDAPRGNRPRGWVPLARNGRGQDEEDGLGKPKFTIPKFEGGADVEEYLTWELKIEKLWSLHPHYTDDRKIKLASSEFDGYALRWWDAFVRNREEDREQPIRTWRAMKEAMTSRFVPTNYLRNIYDKLTLLRQGVKTVDEYYMEMEMLMQRGRVRESLEMTMQRFLNGLKYDIKGIVRHYSYTNMNQLLHHAREAESQLADEAKIKGRARGAGRFTPRAAPSMAPAPSTRSAPPPSKSVSNVSNTKKSESAASTSGSNVSTARNRDMVCHTCGGKGHFKRDCPNRKVMVINEDNEYETGDDVDPNAPEDDDYDTDGEDAYPSDARTIVVSQRALNVLPSASTQRCNLFQTKALVGPDKACKVIIDGGSCRNLASKELCTKLKLKYLPHPHPYYIQWLSDNGEMKVNHMVRVEFAIGPYKDCIDFDVVPMTVCHLLLGRPWLYDRSVQHNGRANTYHLEFKGKKINLQPMTPQQIVNESRQKVEVNLEDASLDRNLATCFRMRYPQDFHHCEAMDRSWITDGTKKFTTKYMAGVRDFIKFAREHLDNTDEPILCPCKDCLNLIRQDIKTVEDHCNCSGMSMMYTRWTRHGEDFSDDEGRDRNDDGAYDSDNDEEEDNGDCYVDDSSSMIDELQKSGNKGPDLPNLYANLIESAKKELYEGCTSFTRLSFIIKLLHVKSYSRITNRGFDLLLQLLRTALPDVDFPKSYADAKSVLSDVGLGYETIHACKFDCSLFWGDHKDDTNCHVCGLSRYRDPTGKKKIPHKVLRYFPIIKRLQRLFVKKEMSTHTRWHKEKRVVEPNVLRHPADGEAWKHFDGKFDWFAKDPRNIRLGFATDGFSPFGSMSNPYSMWPVFVIPYNFPPWMCMDQSNYMMALLIPGKYSPGKDFHVFMQPLIKDMMQLWSGVETFDACTEEYFPLHAAFLWKSRLFNGTTETRDPPRKYTPKEVAAKVEMVKDFEHGKNPISRKRKRATVPGEPTWHLKVSLHHLPYWPELKIAHNLDVMHIEKNICDNIVGTLLELEGRNKDTVSARIDLKKFKMWKKYWLKKIVKDDDDAAVTYAKPPAPWTLSKEQKRHLCRFFKDGTETRFNKDDRNQDIRRKPDPDEMEVFSVGAKGLGKSILKHFDKEFDKMVWYVLNNCDDVERYINEFRQELGGRGVRDIEETVQREFAGWFANHVRQLDNASEDLKSLAAGPDRRVVVYAGCNVKGARFRTLTRDKDLKTQNSGVATKGSFGDADETDYYGVLQEVLELQYGTNKHGDRSVYLFRCDWFDLASKGSKIKDDGFFKSVNTSILWFKNSPFILASQAETCFYLEDTKFGDPWKVVQKFSHRHVYDVPELEDGNDDAFVRNEDAYQEDEGSVDHTFHDVVDLDEEAEVEAEEDDHRAAEVVRIHDARTIRELENGEDSPNVDMDMSEDELENQEDSLILEENIHDDEGKNSEEDSDLD